MARPRSCPRTGGGFLPTLLPTRRGWTMAHDGGRVETPGDGKPLGCIVDLYVGGRRGTPPDGGVADRVGFEPTVRFPPRSFSKAVPSASRPPIQLGALYSGWMG